MNVLFVLIFTLGIVSFSGCGEDKVIMDTEEAPQPDAGQNLSASEETDKTSNSPALSEEEAWEKAKTIVREMWWQEQQLKWRSIVAEGPATFNEDRDRMRVKVSGLTPDQIAFFQTMNTVEVPQDLLALGALEAIKAQRSSILALHNLIGVYLKLSFQYPEKTEPQLLELFREAAKNKETQINLVEWSEEEAWEKAKKIVRKFRSEEEKLINKARREDDWIKFDEDLDRLGFEMTGLTFDDLTALDVIHFAVHPEDRKVLEEGAEYTPHDLIGVYLKLLFLHPEKIKTELFLLFQEAAENGETHVLLEVVERIYGIKLWCC